MSIWSASLEDAAPQHNAQNDPARHMIRRKAHIQGLKVIRGLRRRYPVKSSTAILIGSQMGS
ncbi:hypothetical protein BN2475_40108 [Paraburkholderia ribeironis]|uniref:Uncharacterized protein n=1 Tax=Paraburkholderia ribeironis TaxID=1247936 RepID=A0A1N7RJL2_9BURK|nr:hypothetical protein BN2475_40108 [Paraburkholderia ribeironis]